MNKMSSPEIIIEKIRNDLQEKFEQLAEPMRQYDFTKSNYDELFPRGIITTPIGDVKLGKHQFDKLREKKRENLLGAMYQTLSDPIAIVEEARDGKKALLYTRAFKKGAEKIKTVVSVVVTIDNINVAISTHRRSLRYVLQTIKNTASVIYQKPYRRLDGLD
jgi:hypothetical protein